MYDLAAQQRSLARGRVKPKPSPTQPAWTSLMQQAAHQHPRAQTSNLTHPPPSAPPPPYIAPPLLSTPLPPPTLVLHTAAMFKQLIPRASTRGALSSGFQSAQALRSTAPSTTLLQQRIWQRRGYATETGRSFLSMLSAAPIGMLTFAQRRRTLLSSVAVLPDMSPPSRLARRASRYVQERGNKPQEEKRTLSNTSCYRLLALRSVAPSEVLA